MNLDNIVAMLSRIESVVDSPKVYSARDNWAKLREVTVKILTAGLDESLPHGTISYSLELIRRGFKKRVIGPQDEGLVSAIKAYKNSPYPRLREGALRCLELLQEMQQEKMQQGIGASLASIDELILRIIKGDYKSQYQPNIFYAKDRDEFWRKIDDHNKPLHKLEAVSYDDDVVVRGCFYSHTLKECIVSPGINSIFGTESDNPFHYFMMLKYFERIFHEVTHGLVDSVQGDEEILDPTLEEYVVSLCAHQLTIDYAGEITNGRLSPGEKLYQAFVERNRLTSLTPHQEETIARKLAIEGLEPKEIVSYLIPKLISKEGLREIK